MKREKSPIMANGRSIEWKKKVFPQDVGQKEVIANDSIFTLHHSEVLCPKIRDRNPRDYYCLLLADLDKKAFSGA